jgi:hypothetical protein
MATGAETGAVENVAYPNETVDVSVFRTTTFPPVKKEVEVIGSFGQLFLIREKRHGSSDSPQNMDFQTEYGLVQLYVVKDPQRIARDTRRIHEIVGGVPLPVQVPPSHEVVHDLGATPLLEAGRYITTSSPLVPGIGSVG